MVLWLLGMVGYLYGSGNPHHGIIDSHSPNQTPAFSNSKRKSSSGNVKKLIVSFLFRWSELSFYHVYIFMSPEKESVLNALIFEI